MLTLIAQLDLAETYTITPGGEPVVSVFESPAAFLNQAVVPNLFVVAALIMFVFVLMAGFRVIMNPASTKSFDESRKSLGYALGGFILLLASYWIIQIVQRVLGVSIL